MVQIALFFSWDPEKKDEMGIVWLFWLLSFPVGEIEKTGDISWLKGARLDGEDPGISGHAQLWYRVDGDALVDAARHGWDLSQWFTWQKPPI